MAETETKDAPKKPGKGKGASAPKTDLMKAAEKRAAEALAEPGEWRLDPRKGFVLVLSVYPSHDLILKPRKTVQGTSEKNRRIVDVETQKRVKLIWTKHIAYLPEEYLENLSRAPYYGMNFITALELRAALDNRAKKKGFTLLKTAKGAEGFISEMVRRSELTKAVGLNTFTVIKELMRLPEEPEMLERIEKLKQSWYDEQRTSGSIVVGQ